jgi:hypothetical protein
MGICCLDLYRLGLRLFTAGSDEGSEIARSVM